MKSCLLRKISWLSMYERDRFSVAWLYLVLLHSNLDALFLYDLPEVLEFWKILYTYHRYYLQSYLVQSVVCWCDSSTLERITNFFILWTVVSSFSVALTPYHWCFGNCIGHTCIYDFLVNSAWSATNKFYKCAFILSLEEHMKRDHNIFVSRVSFFCSISFLKNLKYFMQCIVGTVYMLLLFLMIKFTGYRNFQISLCNLKFSDFL